VSSEWQSLPEGSISASDIHVTTAEGYRYPLEGSWGWSEASVSSSNWLGTGGALLPPGFRAAEVALVYGDSTFSRANHLVFRVAQNSDGYKVHIPGCDAIDLDRDIKQPVFPVDQAATALLKLGAVFPVRNKGGITPKACVLEVSPFQDPQLILTVAYANASGGYDTNFNLVSWVTGNDGVLRPEVARMRSDGAQIALDSVLLGPGQTLDAQHVFRVPETTGDFKLLLTGDLPAVYDLDCERRDADLGEGFARSIPWLPLDQDTVPGTWYFGLNLLRPPFDNPLVRQAFALALDREALIRGVQSPAATFTPPETLGGSLYGRVGLRFDPERARSLLAEAGYPDAQGFPRVTLITRTRNALYGPTALAAAPIWNSNLGVEVDVVNVDDWNEYLRQIDAGAADIWALAWAADYNDPDNFMSIFLSHSEDNHSGFENSEYDTLVLQARAAASEPSERQKLYIQAERVLCEQEAAVIPVYHRRF
jgi:hypothetical protein